MWQRFLAWAVGVGHNLLEFMSPLATTIANAGGQVLTDAATAEVAAAESAAAAGIAAGNVATGESKFLMAQAGVVATLVSKDIPVVMNAVNGAIEMAVANMNALVTQAAPSPTPVAAIPAAPVAAAPATATQGA